MKKRRDLKGLALLGLKEKPRKRWLEDLVGRLCVAVWRLLARDRDTEGGD